MVKSKDLWAGDVYHNTMRYILTLLRAKSIVNLNGAIDFATELAYSQFQYSKDKNFINEVKSKSPAFRNQSRINTFLALFEHVYDLPDNDILKNTQDKLRLWLTNTYQWGMWREIQRWVRELPKDNVYVEPDRLKYTIDDIEISARMDFGLEFTDGKLLIFDWKCYDDSLDFEHHNNEEFKHQLLTYAIWATRRDYEPLQIKNISTLVFNPETKSVSEYSFDEEDVLDFELTVKWWVSFHNQIFTDYSEVEIDDLSGPRNPQNVCSWCQFKQICGEEIEWHNLD